MQSVSQGYHLHHKASNAGLDEVAVNVGGLSGVKTLTGLTFSIPQNSMIPSDQGQSTQGPPGEPRIKLGRKVVRNGM